jgi:hypothetical protein
MRSHSNNTLHEILSKHAARILFACYFVLRVDALECVELLADAPLCVLFDEEDLAVRLVREPWDDDVFA